MIGCGVVWCGGMCVRVCVCVLVGCRLGYVQSRVLSDETRNMCTVTSKWLLGIHCISYYGSYIINNAYVSYK